MENSSKRVTGGNITWSAVHSSPPRWMWALVALMGVSAIIGVARAIPPAHPSADHTPATHSNFTAHRP